jgi:predicted 2-oxoglutarate/Fe(II)-dependent dioxygenase YbiX
MLICNPDILSAAEITEVLGVVAQGKFVDGLATAGANGVGIKRNLEYQRLENKLTAIDRLVI